MGFFKGTNRLIKSSIYKYNILIYNFFMLRYKNYYEIKIKDTSQKIHSITQKNLSESVVVGISPCRKLDIKLQGEHYANWIGGMVKNSFFIDADLSYSFKNNYKIYCSINNILNDKIGRAHV